VGFSQHPARSTCSSLRKKSFHIDILLLVFAEAQQVERSEVEQVCDDEFGELLDGDVVDAYRIVVELAAVGDRALEAGDARDQVLEVSIALSSG
jgi:hypothetical protein